MNPIPPPIVIELRGYSLSELARLYKVSDRTFKKWLLPFAAEVGPKQGRFFNVRQLQIILKRLGLPDQPPSLP